MIRWAWVLSGLIGCAPALCQVSLTEAVQATLARHPQLEVQRERVVEACSRVKQASGIFDVQVDAMTGQSYTHLPLTGLQQLEVQQAGFPVSDQSSNVTTATGSASRLLPGGIAVTASASLTRATDNLVQTGGTNLSQIRLQLNIPMLRGRGRAVVTADEAAAKIESDASVYDLNHLAATLMSDTAIRYWELVGAWRTLEVWREAEARGRELLASVQTLIGADKLPRSEIQQVLANVADRTSNLAGAEQRLVEATQGLALAMGLSAEDLRMRLDPSDPMPDGEKAPLPSMNADDISGWIQRSLSRRADYLGLRQLQGAYTLRRDAAANQLKPQLDLSLATGYSGLREGRRPDQFLAAPFSNLAGLDVVAGLSYSLPLGRHAAQGRLEQVTSASRQNELNTADSARSIASAVLAGIGAYKSAIIRVRQARTAVNAAREALEGEKEKLRLGAGSVIDLLTLEDRLTSARESHVNAQLNYAVLIARLRFATGTILSPDRPSQTVRSEIFYRPPWEGDEK